MAIIGPPPGWHRLPLKVPQPIIPTPMPDVETDRITPVEPVETKRARQRWECKAYRDWYVGLGPRPADEEMYG